MGRLSASASTWVLLACKQGASGYPSQAIVDKTFNLYQPHVRRPFGLMEWPAMLRYLDRRDASYKT